MVERDSEVPRPGPGGGESTLIAVQVTGSGVVSIAGMTALPVLGVIRSDIFKIIVRGFKEAAAGPASPKGPIEVMDGQG